MPLTEFLARSLDLRPDALALTDGRRSWSFRELAGAADEMAAVLRAGGSGKGAVGPSAGGPGPPEDAASGARVVAVVLRPTAASVIAIHGVVRAGAVVAPLNPKLTAPELAAALDVLRPASVVTSESEIDRMRSCAESVGIGLGRVRTAPGPCSILSAERGAALLAADGVAAVLWTSGTSGRPRGVLLTASALGHVAAASRERLGLTPDDRWCLSLSPAHVGGLALVTRAALLGSAVVAPGLPDVRELSGLLEAGRVTHASLVPILLRRLLDARGERPSPAGLRALLVGGAASGPALVERALRLDYPVALTYGLTEATSQVATAPPELVRRKPGTVGPPLPGVEVRLAEDGEILVRGPTLAVGTLGHDGLDLLAEGGWLRTGDLGAWDDEGHLRITGRRSQRIVTGGVTVDPGEVEAVLLAHPAVREACVVGLPDPDWGERVAAAVVMERGAPSQLDDVDALCRERLTSAKVPRRLRSVAELPRNPNGKVDREAVRALLE